MKIPYRSPYHEKLENHDVCKIENTQSLSRACFFFVSLPSVDRRTVRSHLKKNLETFCFFLVVGSRSESCRSRFRNLESNESSRIFSFFETRILFSYFKPFFNIGRRYLMIYFIKLFIVMISCFERKQNCLFDLVTGDNPL